MHKYVNFIFFTDEKLFAILGLEIARMIGYTMELTK